MDSNAEIMLQSRPRGGGRFADLGGVRLAGVEFSGLAASGELREGGAWRALLGLLPPKTLTLHLGGMAEKSQGGAAHYRLVFANGAALSGPFRASSRDGALTLISAGEVNYG